MSLTKCLCNSFIFGQPSNKNVFIVIRCLSGITCCPPTVGRDFIALALPKPGDGLAGEWQVPLPQTSPLPAEYPSHAWLSSSSLGSFTKPSKSPYMKLYELSSLLQYRSSKIIADRIMSYLGYSLPGLPQSQTSDDWRRSSRNIWARVWECWLRCSSTLSPPKLDYGSKDAFLCVYVSSKLRSEVDFSWSARFTPYWIWTARFNWKDTIPIRTCRRYDVSTHRSFNL